MSTMTLTGTTKKTKFGQLKTGDVLSETQYWKVVKIVGDQVQLVNDTGNDVVVDALYVNDNLVLADYYESEEKKSRTELIELFMSHPYTGMAVNFNKQVKSEDVLKEILNTHQNTAPAKVEAEFRKALKGALEGVERTARGRHYGKMDGFGRVAFTDMDKDKGTDAYDKRTIQVDPRNLNWMILKGVKYIAK